MTNGEVELKGSTDSIQCNVYHPITQEVTVSYYAPGTSAGEILGDIYQNKRILEYVTIDVDGTIIDVDHSSFFYPRKTIDIYIQPGAAVAIPLIVSAVVGFVSYQYAKSKFGNQAESEEIDTIRGQRNRDKRYDPVRIVVGERRVVPDLAAQPWTEVEGDQQYLNLLLSVAHAPVLIQDIRIGDTAIGDFGNDVEYEIYDGYQNTDDITLFTQDVVEEDIGFDFKKVGSSEIRTTAPDIDEIIVDTLFPQGLWRQSSSGGAGNSHFHFTIEYREVGSGSWTTQLDWFRDMTQTKAFFVSERWRVPLGQYEVRVTLQDKSSKEQGRMNDFTWMSLKSLRHSDPVSTRGVALLAIRIRADERTSGNLDRVNCIVHGLVPVGWESDWSDWRPTSSQSNIRDSYLDWHQQSANFFSSITMKSSSNPAEWFRWIVQGPFISKKVGNDKFDLDQLEYFRDYCNTNSFSVNAEIAKEKTLAELLNKIAATSLGELIVKGGKYSVAIDEPKDFYSAVYTFKNAADLSFEREFLEEIDGYRLQFDNKETDYEEDEIVISLPGNSSTTGNFERIQRWGITNYDQAYTIGRHLLAERQVRQEAYAFTANIQSVDVTRGDLVLVQMPTVGIGISSGRVTSISGNNITVDERSAIEEETLDHAVLIIKPNNDVAVKDVISSDGTTLELSDTTGIEVDDRFSFGVKDNETRECLVREVEPSDDLSFDVKLVNYGPEIFDIDGEAIPLYSAVVNLPDIGDMLPEPSIRYIRVYRTRIQTENGSWRVNVDIGYSYPTSYGSGSFQVQLEYREQGELVWTEVGVKDSQQSVFTIENLKDLRVYDFRLRSRGDGATSPWIQQSRFIESSTAEDPPLPKVNGLQLYGTTGNEFTGNDVKLVWRPTSNTRNYELGQEPAGADDGGYDPFFKDYLVEVIDVLTGEVIRETYVKDPEYNYTFEKNLEDGGPRRKLKFRVSLRGTNNQISNRPTSIIVRNPAPELHTAFSVSERFTGVEVRWAARTDVDFRGTRVFVSKTSGFTPSDDTLVYDGEDTQVQIGGLDGTTDYYLRYEVYDVFGRDLATQSGEFAFTTLDFTVDLSHLGSWAEVDVGTTDQIESWLSGEAPDPELIPRITAGQIVSGVIQATELIDSQGVIRVLDSLSNPNFLTILGPFQVADEVWLLHARPWESTNVVFGIDQFGNAYFSGDVEASNIYSGKEGINDFTNPGFYLRSDGALNFGDSNNFFTWTNNVLTMTGTIKSGKSTVTDNTSGFFLSDDGQFNFGDGTSFVKWDGTELSLSGDITGSIITGSTLQTATSGERFVVDSSDNRARWIGSDGSEIATIGSTQASDGGLYAIRVNAEDNRGGIWSAGSGGSPSYPAAFFSLQGQSTSNNSAIFCQPGPTNHRLRGETQISGDIAINIGANIGHPLALGCTSTGETRVGSLVYARYTGSGDVNYGETISGDNLRPGNSWDTIQTGNMGSGTTWRCLGFAESGGGQSQTTMWQRVS